MRGLLQIPDTFFVRKLILFVFILLGFIHVVRTYTGPYDSDDVNYARAAATLSKTGFSPDSTQQHYHELRWSVVYSAAIFYKIFGVNEISSALPAIIAFALTGWLILIMTRRSTIAVFLLCMILFFLSRTVVYFQYRLLPDPILCLAAVWMYQSYRAVAVENNPAFRSAFIFSLAFFLALITKESVIILFPLFFFFLVKDIIQKKHLEFWKIAVPSVLAVIFLYLLYFRITTGDFLYRYHLIQSGGYKNICSFDQLPFIHTLRRIGYQLWQSFLVMGDMMLILPAIAGWIHRRKLTEVIPQMDHAAIIVLLLSANFMTVSISSYVPLCHDHRHFMFILPFCVLTGAPLIYAYFRNPVSFPALPALFVAATSIMFVSGEGNLKFVYALFTLLMLGVYAIKRSGTKVNLWVPVGFTAAIFFLNYLKDYIKPMYPYYHDNKLLITGFFGSGAEEATVVSSDPLSAELNEFFFGFEPRNARFVSVRATDLPADSVYYFHLNRNINVEQAAIIDSIKQNSADFPVELLKKINDAELYRTNQSVIDIIRQGLR